MTKKEIEIVLDVETTGLDYTREKIIEFAAVKLVNGEVIEQYETLINPQQHIRKSSIAIHGITEEMVQDAPNEEEVFPKILEFIGEYPLVAHNAIFDFSFLNRASKRLYNKPLTNKYIDTQEMFKEVHPQCESCGLEALMGKFGVEFQTRHRAMADAMGLALVYPKLKKLYFQKYDWQLSQIENVEYLFERYLRIQQAIAVMQSEIQDLRSIFKIYFEKGGDAILANTGELLTYGSKKTFVYDFLAIKDLLDEIGALPKAVKLNNAFVDRLVSGASLDKEIRDKIKSARTEITENKSFNVVKPDKRCC
ncbi:DNA polymerase III polC-type [Candidatus Gastranaerophilus sp. (ex Termes propinquus)]|nr:DNA polymerase III polC-type [Candidatus Gastranaerophilus sp. (ex Termes propinquus)]